MRKLLPALVLLPALLSSFEVAAHHSFSATFQEDAKITIEGVVTSFSFKNPHILVYTDVTNDDGSVTEWVSEGPAATLVRRGGWTRDSLEPGDRVRITGDSTHDGSPMTSLDNIEFVDAEGIVTAELSPSGYRDTPQATEKAEEMALTFDDGRPNLTGYWTSHGMTRGGPGAMGGPSAPLSEAGEALQAKFELANDPQVFCDPPGLIRQAAFTPHPYKITQYDDRVVFEYEEYGGTREVYFDGRNAQGIKTHLGDSIAYYEGETLVVESINLLANQTNPAGYVLSDQTTTREVYQRTDSDEFGPVVTLETFITDPVNLTEVQVISRPKMSAGDYEFIENDCHIPLRERDVVNPVMSFFATPSVDVEDADAHCAAVAGAVGQDSKNWVAVSSASDIGDRVGEGPWYNAVGAVVAASFAELETALADTSLLTEQGKEVEDTANIIQCFASDPAPVPSTQSLAALVPAALAATADTDHHDDEWGHHGPPPPLPEPTGPQVPYRLILLGLIILGTIGAIVVARKQA